MQWGRVQDLHQAIIDEKASIEAAPTKTSRSDGSSAGDGESG